MEKRLLTEAQGYDLLKEHDVPVPPHKIVKSDDEAAKAAEKIGYPVVAKIVSPQVVHKSDAGGVVTGIKNEDGIRNAFNQIMHNVNADEPLAHARRMKNLINLPDRNIDYMGSEG